MRGASRRHDEPIVSDQRCRNRLRRRRLTTNNAAPVAATKLAPITISPVGSVAPPTPVKTTAGAALPPDGAEVGLAGARASAGSLGWSVPVGEGESEEGSVGFALGFAVGRGVGLGVGLGVGRGVGVGPKIVKVAHESTSPPTHNLCLPGLLWPMTGLIVNVTSQVGGFIVSSPYQTPSQNVSNVGDPGPQKSPTKSILIRCVAEPCVGEIEMVWVLATAVLENSVVRASATNPVESKTRPASPHFVMVRLAGSLEVAGDVQDDLDRLAGGRAVDQRQ